MVLLATRRLWCLDSYTIEHRDHSLGLAMLNQAERPLPSELIAELQAVEWLEPWWCLCLGDCTCDSRFGEELRKELGKGHVLYPHRRSAKAVAKRDDRDDVLFWLPKADKPFAMVHLTWTHHVEIDSMTPNTSLFDSLMDFVERELNPTHREWLDSF